MRTDRTRAQTFAAPTTHNAACVYDVILRVICPARKNEKSRQVPFRVLIRR
jgi:hypothetical protein